MVTDFKINNRNIVFFDGKCNLCSNSINFILNNEINSNLLFSSLQSKFAKRFLKQYSINSKNHNSIIFFTKNKIYTKSNAIFKILIFLRFYFRGLLIFKILPTFLTNFFYDIISNNRYKWFGKKTICYVPIKDISSRFLED
tara:strand:- start:592 stop:1014 length:423 start_codon:yes stop_codon:yes gene_type:complete